MSSRPIILLPKEVLLLIKLCNCQTELICLPKVLTYIKGVVEGMGNGALSFPGTMKKQDHSAFSDVSGSCGHLVFNGGLLVECAVFKFIN